MIIFVMNILRATSSAALHRTYLQKTL